MSVEMRKTGHEALDRRKESVFAKYDKDGDGTLDSQEFKDLYETIRTEALDDIAKEAALTKDVVTARRRMKAMFGVTVVLAIFLALSVAANSVVIFSIVNGAIPTGTADSGEFTIKGTDKIVRTTAATAHVPLGLFPMLPASTLDTITKLRFKKMPTAVSNRSGLVDFPVITDDVPQINTSVTVHGYEIYDEVSAKIFTSGGTIHFPSTGCPHLEEEDGWHVLCGGDASCASFKVGGDFDTDAMVARREMLTEANRNALMATRRGRAMPTCGPCNCGRQCACCSMG